MGLTIEIGVYADLLKRDPKHGERFLQQLNNINEVLIAKRIPSHDEPATLPKLNNRAMCSSFPYDFLHYLRRYYARVVSYDSDWPAINPEDDPSDDPVLQDELTNMESHLLCHSDAEGYYIPIDFDDILIDRSGQIAGNIVCSSQQLFSELLVLAPHLDIQLTDTILSDEEAIRINTLAQSDEELYREYTVWLALFEASRLSIAHKTAMCFY